MTIYIVDDRLYILEDPSQGCYDISTGKTLWEQTFSLEEMKKQMSVGASIYSCIDENGKFIWGDLPEGSGSLWTKPEVINGNPSGISIRFLFNFNFFNMCAKFFQSADQVFVSALNLIDVADSAFSVSAHRCNHHSHTCANIR